MAKKRMRSEFDGIDSDSGVAVNPMRPVNSGDHLTPNHRMRLINTTGFDSTIMPLNNRAWLGFNQYPPIPIPSRIPKQ